MVSLLGALLFGAMLTLVLGKVFGRSENFPPLAEFPAQEEPWKSVTSAQVTAKTVPHVKFALAFRGYDQRQVDVYLDRVAARLQELERQNEERSI